MDPDVLGRFPDLRIRIARIGGVKVGDADADLERFKEEVFREVAGRYTLESLKDVEIFRAYRDFFWRAGIDPTKIRPAAEALIRRILAGRPLPKINNLVDAYNLASIKTGVALAAFDEDELKGDLLVRFAGRGEEFRGIGMSQPMRLEGGEIVIADGEKLIAVYPHRDSDETKIKEKTRDVLLMICGAPGIGEETLIKAEETAIEYMTRFCGGERRR